MFRALRERLHAWSERRAEAEYVRSVLDASVLRGHGQTNDEAQRELDRLDEEAAELAQTHERGR